MNGTQPGTETHIEVSDLWLAWGERVIMRELNFSVRRGSVFAVMGGSGCGKSTLLRHLTGLMRPARGRVLHDGVDFWAATADEQTQLQRRFGLLFQQGALWSSLTLIENVALPLAEFTTLDRHTIHDIAALKLALVGLAGYEDYMPAEISGGMRKRAALARAMALDPEILFFDEPSAGLDPVTSRRLDDLILEINASLGTTVVLVTHELPSIFAIANDGIFLDAQAQTLIAQGAPAALMDSGLPAVQAFLTRSAA